MHRPPSSWWTSIDRQAGRRSLGPRAFIVASLAAKRAARCRRPHFPLARRAGQLVGGEDSIEVAVPERGEGRLHFVDRDEIDADGEPAHSAALKAWSMSAIRSSTCSMPIESRIVSGATPTRASASGDSWRWVVDAGWATSDLASPMFTSRLKSFTESKKRIPAS